jgi:hypothetical protein
MAMDSEALLSVLLFMPGRQTIKSGGGVTNRMGERNLDVVIKHFEIGPTVVSCDYEAGRVHCTVGYSGDKVNNREVEHRCRH